MFTLTRRSRWLLIPLVMLSLFALNSNTFVVRVQAKQQDGPMQPVWSPDGKRIAMTIVHNEEDWSLEVLDVSTGKLTRLTDDGTSPAWSPDGKQIVYTGSRNS